MRRKVLFLIESLAGGGAEKVLTTLVRHIDTEKFDGMVCAISGGGPYEEEIKKFVKYKSVLQEPLEGEFLVRLVYTLKHHFVYKWLPLSWVYRLFLPQGNDVEVAFVEGFTTKLLSHSLNRKARIYAWVHIDLYMNHWTKEIFGTEEAETKAYQRFRQIFCVSQTVVEGFIRRFKSIEMYPLAVYNPIDSKTIIKMASEKGKEKKDFVRLVTVGRLEPQKGYDRLVQIVNRLIKEGQKLELWILGIGSQEEWLKKYIVENNLSEQIKLLGFHANPYKYMVQGDLFVCSSRSEGYSTAVTEALIIGLPVITTECSGMAELLKDGECGIITANDDEALYAGLKTVLQDTELREHYRQKAIERGKDFTIESLMEPIERALMS